MQDKLEKLRICYCLSHYYPIASGAERQAHGQAKELIRRGHRVQVITRAVAGRPEVESIDGVDVRRWIRPRALGPLFGLTFVTTLGAALRQLRDEYDVVHCHQGLWEAVAAGWMAPRLAKPSVVQPAAGGEFGEINQWSRTRGRGLLRRLMLRNSHFIAISDQIEHELVQFGVAASRLTRLCSGVDIEAFSPGESGLERQLPERPRVLFLGRLHPQKNLSCLLEAWPAVRQRVPATLIFAGDGPERAQLMAAAVRLGIASSVHFAGAVQNPVDYLRAADIFVLPSVAEGMSNSLLEAMATGLPVIASRIGGNTDLLVHHSSGILIDPHDVQQWSSAIVELAEDRDTAARFGAAARETVRTQYSIEAVVDRYLAVYEKLL